ARELGVRRAIQLKVAGAFHSPLMAPAIDVLAPHLEAAAFSDPDFPVWANVDAVPASDVADALRRQVTGTVRFAESLAAMYEAGITTFVHVGPGDVTAGMVKRSVPEAAMAVVSAPGDLDELPDL
ncbi:MAG: malonyl CoA-acyl carrier protein transacylase, partial [Acidimicrobiia bacterium]|nr:malonyl CoA-acyl carrier protein transacylase [Acidimicrobiia bacterium]